MRALVCVLTLLCALGGQAAAGTRGIGGTWFFYGDRDAAVRIDEASGILEEDAGRARYVLLATQDPGRRRAVRQGNSRPGDARRLVQAHEDVLLFLGVKNPVLVRAGARFAMPREKIRGRWRYAEQLNEHFYYDAEFDLDARTLVDISRSERGELVRSEARPCTLLLDAQAELAVQADGVVYHFARLGADFLVLEASYASSSRNGFRILLQKVQEHVKEARHSNAKSNTSKMRDRAPAAADTSKMRDAFLK